MYLGFDTSNYTTSLALFDGEQIRQEKQLLTVSSGQRGLRQSDAVFQHTVNLPVLIEKLGYSNESIKAVGVSTRPRSVDGSYMPCFLVGKCAATAVSRFTGADLYETSHQTGHVLAALYSIDRIDLINQKFIAFHVSGGTTEALLVEPDRENLIKISIVAQSLDLKAGQAIDRAGVMLGLDFPCGAELDRLSQQSDRKFKIKPSMTGKNCSLSGIENKAKKMYENGESACDISKFVLSSVSAAIEEMTSQILDEFGDITLVYAGGVMSNTLIRNNITSRFDAYFAKPQFSCDNAAGIAVYAYLKDNNE